MKIGSVRVKISVLQWAVFIIFTVFFIIAYVASSYDVIILAFGIPTLIIYRDGKEAARASGAMDQHHLIQWIQQNT